MFPIAGQTAGPNGLTFFEGTHWLPGGDIGNATVVQDTYYIHLAHLSIRKTPRSFNTQDESSLVYDPISIIIPYLKPRIIILGIFTLWSLSIRTFFDPKLTYSFLTQIRARTPRTYMYCICIVFTRLQADDESYF